MLRTGVRRIATAGETLAAPLDGIAGLTAAYSLSRSLVSSYKGPYWFWDGSTASSAGHDTWYDQSGNGRNLSNNVRGIGVSCGGTGSGVLGFEVVGSISGESGLISTGALSTFIANNAGYVIASVSFTNITGSNASIWLNDTVWTDNGSFVGVFGKATETINAYNWDGNADTASLSANHNVPLVVEWRHESGTLGLRLNLGTEQTAASGNTSTMTGTFRVLGNNGNTSAKIFELATFNSVPSNGVRDQIALNFMRHVGAQRRG